MTLLVAGLAVWALVGCVVALVIGRATALRDLDGRQRVCPRPGRPAPGGTTHESVRLGRRHG